jgi:hypothetical protein
MVDKMVTILNVKTTLVLNLAMPVTFVILRGKCNFFMSIMFVWSRDSVVGIVTGYRLEDREIGVRDLVG